MKYPQIITSRVNILTNKHIYMRKIKLLVRRIYSKVNKNLMNLIIKMIFLIKVSLKILMKFNLISRVL